MSTTTVGHNTVTASNSVSRKSLASSSNRTVTSLASLSTHNGHQNGQKPHLETPLLSSSDASQAHQIVWKKKNISDKKKTL